MLNASLNNITNTIPAKTWGYITMLNWPLKIGLFIISILAPISDLIHIMVIFLLLDMITSIYAQYKDKIKTCRQMHFGLKLLVLFRTFRSSKARVTLEKAIFYIIALTVVFLFETYVLHVDIAKDKQVSLFSLTNFAGLLIAMVELGSIMANITKITNNKIFITIYKMLVTNVKGKVKDTVSDD